MLPVGRADTHLLPVGRADCHLLPVGRADCHLLPPDRTRNQPPYIRAADFFVCGKWILPHKGNGNFARSTRMSP